MAKPRTRANGEGTAYKRGKTWTAEVILGYRPNKDGVMRPVRVTRGGFRTKTAALEAIPDLKNRGRTAPEKRTVTIDSLWQSYSTSAMKKLSESKQTHYRTARKKLEDIAFIDIRLLTIDDLQETVDEVAPTYYPAKDIKTVLSHLYDRAVAEQILSTNLADYIVLPSFDEKPTVPFEENEVIALWNGWNKGDRQCGYALLMIYTGMMPGELCALRVEMIDFKQQTVVGCGLKTKVRKEHPIILPDIILPVLRKLCDLAPDGKILNCRYDAFCSEFKAMIARYELRPELRPYSCRHTTGTTLAQVNTPLLTIKDVMRHSKVATTQRYVHMDADHLIAAANNAYGEAREG